MPDEGQLIYDWNTVNAPAKPTRPVSIHDETLRDGIQGPSVRDPDIEHKLRFLHLADELGVGSIDLGLPGSGPSGCGSSRSVQRAPWKSTSAR
jgi:isopropylmalate/homocitrate/citramalate synthase